MTRRYIRPKKFDLVVSYVLNGARYESYVDVQKCPYCHKWTVFERECPICGRYKANQLPVFFKIIRLNQLRLIGSPTPDDKKSIKALQDIMTRKGINGIDLPVDEPETDPTDGA